MIQAHFHLTGNLIDRVDPAIGQLERLSDLQLSGNGTEASFQPAISQLKNLQVLRLWNFGFIEVPAAVSQMSNLHTLCLASNALQAFPAQALQLEHLSYLNLGNNQIPSIPKEIGQLVNLNYLGIFNNPISNFPVEALTGLSQLKWIAAWETRISGAQQLQMEKISSNLQVSFSKDDAH